MRENQNEQTEENQMQKIKKSAYEQTTGQSSRSKLFACLAYIPPVWIVSFFAERKNPFVRFHVKQGMKLTLLTLVIGSVAWVLNVFFSKIFSYAVLTPTPDDINHVTTGVNAVGQTLCTIVAFVASIILVAYAMYGIITACRSKMSELPLLDMSRTKNADKTDDI